MIDTKAIRKELEDSRLLIHAKVNYPNPLFNGHQNDVMKFILLLEKICDSHDELERKLKIAEKSSEDQYFKILQKIKHVYHICRQADRTHDALYGLRVAVDEIIALQPNRGEND